jgi:glycosyltransferase involved in cell wall biosynthesis
MSNRIPKVSIGLAVYNGERYLEEAILSILAQTFTDFELIISDNASTDSTTEICQRYANQDSRIRYHRNAENIGGANNENLTFKLAKGEYFRWAAHDDVCAPTLLEKCAAVLDNDTSVVLCHTIIAHIDENGELISTLKQDKASSSRPSERFSDLTGWDHDCEASYGLIRVESLKQTGLQRNYTDSDRSLLCHLALLGRYQMVPELLFYKRIHPDMSTKVFSDWRGRMVWFGESYKKRITFPHWLQFFHYLQMIHETKMPINERFRCYLHMCHWVFQESRWKNMIKDFLIPVKRKILGFKQNNASIDQARSVKNN